MGNQLLLTLIKGDSCSVLKHQRFNEHNFDDQMNEKLQEMYDNTIKSGSNPYTVNFISYCGHGIIDESGDAICVIPIKPKQIKDP